MIASRPIGSLKGATKTSAPVALAARIASSISVTRYPVRSNPNGYGTGVLNPNTDTVPAGVMTSCDMVLLGVGVTVKTPCLAVVPPNVAIRLATKRSKSCGTTYTCVVSYCGPPATPAVLAIGRLWANVLKCCDSHVKPIVRKIATDVPARIFFKRILFLLSHQLPHRRETGCCVCFQRRSPAVYVGRIYFVGHGDVFCKDGTWVVTRLV